MLKLLAVFLRAGQVALFELRQRSLLLLIVALVVVVLHSILVQHLLFHYVVNIHSDFSSARTFLCFHRAFNLLQ